MPSEKKKKEKRSKHDKHDKHEPTDETSTTAEVEKAPSTPTASLTAEQAQSVQQVLDDVCFKLLVIGDSGVGKSAITFRFCDDIFHEDAVPTLGVDFKYSRVETAEHPSRLARLQVWDTAGQETFLSLTTSFYRSAAGILLCFDLTSRLSFLHLPKWLERIHENTTGRDEKEGSTPTPIVVVGCKLDLAGDLSLRPSGAGGGHIRTSSMNLRQVSSQEAAAWCDQNGILCYFETSSKERTNVIEAFRHLATYIVKNTKLDSVSSGVAGSRSRRGQTVRPGDSVKPEKDEKPGCKC